MVVVVIHIFPICVRGMLERRRIPLNQRTLTEEECRTVLRRIAWRIQYQARKYRKRECLGAERAVALASVGHGRRTSL